MSVLFLKHIDIEGPGTMAEFLDKKSIQYKVVDVSACDVLPIDPKQYRAIVILGGPMNVYEEDKYSFLKDEDELIKSALKNDIPMLGLCLGAQLIAKAVDAKVRKSPEKEIGWFKVNLTDDGIEDPLFQGLESEIDVFQWHGDTFDIPDKGLHIALSKACLNQAFRYNDNVYALQFHLEVTKDMVREWLDAYSNEIASMSDIVNREEIIGQTESFSDAYKNQANLFYENFLKIARLA